MESYNTSSEGLVLDNDSMYGRSEACEGNIINSKQENSYQNKLNNLFEYSTEDLDDFIKNIYFDEIENNHGGMKINDMFSFYFLLKKLQPTTIIESGVCFGYSTKLIRKTLGEKCKIICLDPGKIPENKYIDNNINTKYFTENLFIDFKDLDLSDIIDKEKILCFFDDHQNSAQRLIQCIEKNITHIFFNDNYPVNAGSHYSIQHLIDNDLRQKFDLNNQYNYSINTFPQININKTSELINKIDEYIVFPNIFSSKIDLYEGIFDTIGFFKDNDEDNIKKYNIFYNNRNFYCWNTYLTIKK